MIEGAAPGMFMNIAAVAVVILFVITLLPSITSHVKTIFTSRLNMLRPKTRTDFCSNKKLTKTISKKLVVRIFRTY